MPIRWGTPEYHVPRLSGSTRYSFAMSGEALTILFDDAQVTLRATDGRLHAAWLGSIVVPVTGEATTVRAQIRGSVQKEEGGRAVLFANVGGVLTTIDFAYGSSSEEDLVYDFSFDLGGDARRLGVDLLLLAERRDDAADLMLVIDSIDVAT